MPRTYYLSFRHVARAVLFIATSSVVARAELKIEPIPADRIGTDIVSCQAKDLPFEELVAAFEQQTGIAVATAEKRPPSLPLVVYSLDVKNVEPADALNQLGIALGMAVQWDGNGTPRLTNGQTGYAPKNEFRKSPPAGAELAGVVREQSTPPNPGGDRIALRANIRGGPKLLLERATIELKSAVDEKGRALVARPQPPMTNLQRRFLPDTQAELSLDIPQPPPKTIVSLQADVVAQTPKTAQRITLAPLPDEPTIVKLSDIEVRIGPVRQENQQLIIDITGLNVAAVPGELQWFREVSRLRFEDGKQRMQLRVLNTQQQENHVVVRCQLLLPGQRPAASIDKTKARLVWDVVTEVDTVRFPIEVKNLAIP